MTNKPPFFAFPWYTNAFWGLALVFFLQWLLLFSAHVPQWDAAYYYAYARSLAFDQDLYLENDLLAAYPYVGSQYQASRLDRLEQQRTVTGRVDAPFAVGSGLLWTGLLVVLRPLAPLLIASAEPITGYEWPFVLAVATFATLCGFVAFWLGYRLARQMVGEKLAFAAAITLMFTTPLLYYQFRDPIYSHTASALTTGLVVYAWWSVRHTLPSWRWGILLGLLVGFATLVRWQHLMYLALPVVSAIWAWWVLPADQRGKRLKTLMVYGLALGAAALLVFALQMNVWRLFYGSWIAIPQGENFMAWSAPFWRPTLFSPYRGLFLWMPVAFFAFIGLIHLSRRKAQTYLPLLFVLGLEIYINSSTRDWFGGGGFGPRRFTSELVIFLIGYAGFLHLGASLLSRVWSNRGARVLLAGGLGLLLAWHQWILLRYGLSERIGGRNLSMQPDFRWQESTIPEFARLIGGHIGDLFSRPGDFLVLPSSPWFVWQQTGNFPWWSLLFLLGLGLVAAAIWHGGVALHNRWIITTKPAV